MFNVIDSVMIFFVKLVISFAMLVLLGAILPPLVLVAIVIMVAWFIFDINKKHKAIDDTQQELGYQQWVDSKKSADIRSFYQI